MALIYNNLLVDGAPAAKEVEGRLREEADGMVAAAAGAIAGEDGSRPLCEGAPAAWARRVGVELEHENVGEHLQEKVAEKAASTAAQLRERGERTRCDCGPYCSLGGASCVEERTLPSAPTPPLTRMEWRPSQTANAAPSTAFGGWPEQASFIQPKSPVACGRLASRTRSCESWMELRSSTRT